jgi:hypothetical protein
MQGFCVVKASEGLYYIDADNRRDASCTYVVPFRQTQTQAAFLSASSISAEKQIDESWNLQVRYKTQAGSPF